MGNDKITNPCKGCTERNIGCHSECQKYIDFRTKLDEYNNTIRENRERADILYHYKINSINGIKSKNKKSKNHLS